MDCFSIVLWLIIGLTSLVYLFFKKRYAHWKNREIPYLEPTIPMGTLPFKRIEMKEFTRKFYEQKGDNIMMGGFLFAQPFLVTTDLDLIQNILVTDFSSFHERGMYVNETDDPLTAHMFSVDGEKWKMLRSKLSPTFTSGKMKFMYPTVVEVAERFDSILAKIVGKSGKELEMKDLLAKFTTDVIGTCAFGIECNSLENSNSDFRNYGRKIFAEPATSMIVQMFALQYPDFARKLHIRVFAKDVTKFFLDTVNETIDYREKNKVRRNDFMDLLIRLKNGESLDDEKKTVGRLNFVDIAAQAFLFFVAGFETSSTAMMFALYELALNPGIQERAREEIETVLRNHDGKLTYDAMKDMTYIDQIINESLRKYPPAVHLLRQCARTYQVPNTKYTIEKGTAIFIPVYWIHRDPQIYSDPENFDPDRFAPEQIKSRHPMAFLGFGAGPRNCIGLRFGKMQSQIGLIMLLKNYRFKVSSQTPVPIVYSRESMVLSPEGGMYLQVERI